RDYKVTGVQTCALPIWFVLDIANPQEKRAREIADALQVALKNLQGLEEERERTMAAVEFLSKLRTAKAELQAFRDRMHRRKAERSEERRVGEEERRGRR